MNDLQRVRDTYDRKPTALDEKNAHILSLSDKLAAALRSNRDLQSALTAAQDRIFALEQANDRLGTDLFKADVLLDRIRAGRAV